MTPGRADAPDFSRCGNKILLPCGRKPVRPAELESCYIAPQRNLDAPSPDFYLTDIAHSI
jgi:hypothetical protein